MKNLIIVRGGGDLATGTIYKLKKSGFPVLILEVSNPSAIRRNVAFCEAVYQGVQTVENMTCYLAESLEQAQELLLEGKLAVLLDPAGESISKLKPLAVVDAILAKKNLGTNRNMAPVTVALGPGFTAGVDVDAAPLTLRAAAQGPQYAHGGVRAESRLLWVRGAGSWDAHCPRPLLCLPVPRVGVPLPPLLLWSPRRALPLTLTSALSPGSHTQFQGSTSISTPAT